MSTIIHRGISYEVFDELSNKSLTGWDLSLRNDLNGKVIYNSCIANEKPNAQVLPANLTGAKFICCNLNNVVIPNGNEVIDCSVKKFQVQNDGEDWIIDNDLKPLEPVNKKYFHMLGLSIDPMDIPAQKTAKAITTAKREQLEAAAAEGEEV